MQPALSFTVLEKQVNLQPLSDSVGLVTATAQQKKQGAVDAIQGLMRTVGNRNAHIDQVRTALTGAIDELEDHEEHDGNTPDVTLVTILKGQRDTALQHAQQSAEEFAGVPDAFEAAFQDEEDAVPDSAAGKIAKLAEQRDTARLESTAKDVLIQEAQSQLELMAARIQELQQRLLQLNGSMGNGMDALLAQAAQLTDPVDE